MEEIVKTQLCCTCKEDKPLSEFHNDKKGQRTKCKVCVKAYQKIWLIKNREKHLNDCRENYRKNSQKIRDQKKAYYEENKEKIKSYNEQNKEKRHDNYKSWVKVDGKEHRKQYITNKMKTDVNYRLSSLFSTAICNSLLGAKGGRHWEDIVGYTIYDLRNHLEKLFKDGMNWDNYGIKGWHIDHVIPRSWFNFLSYEDEEFKRCWSLNNLQPKWAKDNLSKNNRYIG